MSTSNPKPTSNTRSPLLLLIVATLAAAGTVASMALWHNIMQRKAEARQYVFQVVDINETTYDPAEWAKNYPSQYESYCRTVDTERTRYGGSEAFQKLDANPLWRTIFNGYAFAVDYREERGHAYMLVDQDETERVKQFNQPGACLNCHASMLPSYRYLGAKAGIPDSQPREQLAKGFEALCAIPYKEARHMTDDQGNPLIQHPVACIDCHEPNSMALRITRPSLMNALQDLALSDYPIPHIPSIERWRKSNRKQPYDVNLMASRQEKRSLVCAQCHVEYHFKGPESKLTYPWHNGLKVEQMEAWYNETGHVDWKHADSGAEVLKAQHPEFELWSQGIHARSGVSCADCHMPFMREGSVKVSSHHVRSPMLNIAQSCQKCHNYPEEEILARVDQIQERTSALMTRAEHAVVNLIESIVAASANNASPESLAKARALQRSAQWRLDFISAENSMGFHAPQETARILGESIDLAHQGRLALPNYTAK